MPDPAALRPAIASHRGGALLWPENSLAACRRALALPAEQLEIDVHLTADDVPVVIHDATLDRTTDLAGPVRALPFAAVACARLRGAGGEGPPSLAAVAALTRDAGRVLRLEVKVDVEGRPYPGAVARCAAVLDAAGMRGRTQLIGFAPAVVADAAALGGFAGLGLLFGARDWRGLRPRDAAARAAACGAGEVGLPLAEWEPAAVAAIQAAGLAVGAWGVDTPEAARRARRWGIDCVTTDDPVAVLAALRPGCPPGPGTIPSRQA